MFTIILLALQLGVPIWDGEAWAKAGERIEIAWDCEDPESGITGWRLYRSQAKESVGEALIATGGPTTRTFFATMPKNVFVSRYWFKIRPVAKNLDGTVNLGPASEELIVNRKP